MTDKYNPGTVPKDVWHALEYEIQQRDLEYADNYRFTPSDDPEGQAQFEEARDRGCCGSFETGFTDSTGRQWLLGCNYGH